MFYFYNTDQSRHTEAHCKGVLFEQLLRTYLQAAGYEVELTRTKHASLEYDLKGKHKLDNRDVIGEAKAHTDSVSGSHVAAFVGKALPFLHRDPPYSAVFLSTSTLTPEACDYLENLQETTPHRVVHRAGKELEDHIREILQLPTAEEVFRVTKAVIPAPSGQHLVHTDLGTFIGLTGSGSPGSFDDRFLLIDRTGRLVANEQLLAGIRQNLQPFEELSPVSSPIPVSTTLASSGVREIPEGLLVATSWIDYRRPAGPDYFIGRQSAIANAKRMILAGTGTVIEVKSKSGVGKSSLLSVLRENLVTDSHRVDLHDARDVQSSADVLRLLRRFTSPGEPVPTYENVPDYLSRLHNSLGDRSAVFMVDQMESSFLRPEVFTAYEYIALCISRASGRIAFVFSRKDDLLTTHDDLLVSLDRFRASATTINLEDFNRDEALTLVRHAAVALPTRASSRILSQVLEFAQGFPWLLKRTMAHLSTILEAGVKQEELISSGLHLEELFEEELAGLDEHERGYLTRLASYLPATYQALARRFENDPLLPRMLEHLTSRRILRLAAGTYDIYNDVFKDYLVYERLPERGHTDVYRMGLVPVVEGFRALGSTNRFTPESLANILGRSLGGTYNLMREMRLAGLVARTGESWQVPTVVRQYEHQGRLGEYVRQSVLKNRAVSDLVLEVERAGSLRRRDQAGWLQRQFPFVEAREDVWRAYSNHLIDWCRRLRLLTVGKDGLLRVGEVDQEAVVVELGNLELAGRGTRPPDAVFVPSVPFSTAHRVLSQLVAASGSSFDRSALTRSEATALKELVELGAVKKLSRDHFIALEKPAEFEARIKDVMAEPPYSDYWSLLLEGVPWPEALRRAFSFHQLASGTLLALGKRTANWGRSLGHLPKKRLSFARDQTQTSMAFISKDTD